MGREFGAHEYKPDKYLRESALKQYMPLYEAAADLLPPPGIDCNRVIELGCGVGHFAELLYAKGYYYLGLDFSPAMIEEASNRILEYKFFCEDIRDSSMLKLFNDYMNFVALEVLEHIKDDLKVVEAIPSGALFIFSVPNYDSKAHVRHFARKRDVIDRYKFLLSFEEGTDLTIHHEHRKNKIFLFSSYRRERNYTMRDLIIKDLRDLKKIMDDCGIPFVLLYGAALGYVRHGDIMEWDNDIDIGVFVDVPERKRLEFYDVLMSRNFKRKRNWNEWKAVFIQNVKVDISWFKREDGFWIRQGKTVRKYPTKFFADPQRRSFLDDTYFFPNHLEEYLALVYGDWKTVVKDRTKWLKMEKAMLKRGHW